MDHEARDGQRRPAIRLLRDVFPRAAPRAATLIPTRDLTFPETPWYSFKDLSPRLGVSYDVFGNGKTAVKASFGRYVLAIDPTQGNPVSNIANSVTRTWTDANGNFFPDCVLTNPQQQDLRASGGDFCGTISDLGFGGVRPTSSFDPDHHQRLGQAWIQRGILDQRPARAVAARRRQRRLLPPLVRQLHGHRQPGRRRLPTSIRSAITAPADPRLPGGGTYVIGGLFNLNPGKVGHRRQLHHVREQLRQPDRALERPRCDASTSGRGRDSCCRAG